MRAVARKIPALPEWTRLFVQAFGRRAEHQALPLDFRVLAAMLMASEGELVAISTTEIVAKTRASREGVLKAIRRLVAADLVLIEGTSRARRYRLSPEVFYKGDAEQWGRSVQVFSRRRGLAVVPPSRG